ncbi:universal stress protein [Marinobacter sp. ATCH36]|uniref:universal stress protein n=1 Tax=Marinobacter sp. ATCH36 TaxID=2945106 RepID=UPI0020216484|nr:universal stress protein [Marinobacter sp. ATCH36]MCL7945515.1 universal stress protein [Marinobacter sp. ATCH36]
MNNQVIACFDGSDYAQAVADAASWTSKTLGAPLTLLHVMEAAEDNQQQDAPSKSDSMLTRLSALDQQRVALNRERGELLLDFAAGEASNAGVPDARRKLVRGNLMETLAGLQDDLRVLVVGKRGESATEESLGSHLEQMIRTNPRPTLIVGREFTAPTKALLAFDGSDTMVRAINTIASSPMFHHLECHVVLVGAETDEHREQLTWAETTLENANVDVKTHLAAETFVDATLTAYAKENDIDLMVMGAYGHSRLRHMLVGSTTSTLLKHTRLTLLVLR